ncbi:NusA-like transcription termination signal-binding factor [Candidatus Woesearchaeota archaeon]|nr:NusA-like transcription termination signal-binding factor [Candidatus Woesearchaeota archaeon]
MSRMKLDSESMKLMAFFESNTGAKVKDCIPNDKLIFIIEENEMGKAIGKNGANIKKMERLLKKKIKLAEFSNDALQFVRNLCYPAEISDAKLVEDIITIHGKDTSTRAMLIGRERRNINNLAEIVRRYFNVKEIRVV